VKWVSSFISNITTPLCLPGYNTNAFLTRMDIPHGSLLLPLFLYLYNANPITNYNLLTMPAAETDLVDNVTTISIASANALAVFEAGKLQTPTCFALCFLVHTGGLSDIVAPNCFRCLRWILTALFVQSNCIGWTRYRCCWY
jgi:hypothetical protein